MQKRLLLLQAAVLLGVVCVQARLFYLQVFQHSAYSQKAFKQQFTARKTSGERGFIQDRSGALMAMNVDLYNILAHPKQMRDKAAAAMALANATGQSYACVLSKLSDDKNSVWVARKVPYEKSADVEKLDLPGIETSVSQHRFYPDHEMASHVIGCAGVDNQGLNGLERNYNKDLRGKNGMVLAERDAWGRLMLSGNKTKSQSANGLNIVTTIDKTIQHIAQVELEKAFVKFRCKGASILVMDPKTGEILAMANYPTFDPNRFSAYPKESWKNRIVNDATEPGSTFKLIAAVGALEENIVNEEDKFFCENGSWRINRHRVVSDHEKHGTLTFREIFGYSSNIGMVKVSQKLGAENLYRYAKRFGFGEPTGIDLPWEVKGRLRPLEQWSGLSLTSIPYGYEVEASPLQMLNAYAAVANGGNMMRPYLVKKLVNKDGSVVKEFGPKKTGTVCSAKTAKRITEMLKWAVEKGTGTQVALSTYSIAGKTGTAYKFMNGRYSRYNYYSSFIGFVPADEPRFAIYVSLDDPRGIYWGGYTAGPVFKEVAKRTLAYALVPTSSPEDQILASPDKKAIPSFQGLTPAQCKWLAAPGGLKLKFSGKGVRVVDQSLGAGLSPAGDKQKPVTIVLTLGGTEELQARAVMPDLRGKTKRQALAMLSTLGVKVNFKGEGVVRTQFPPAGRAVQGQTNCDLNCDIPITKAGSAQRGGPS
jgi:stage V sporulation protein D (sporulation-specific penicillin-binding protein)